MKPCYLLVILGISTITVSAHDFVIPPHKTNMHYVIRQAAFDCGPAALATLLHFYFGIPTTKAEAMRLTGHRAREGTTLLGLEKAARAKGCTAGSFRMTFQTLEKQLATHGTPVIVRTWPPHFSVVLAVRDGFVYVADPAAGNIVLTKAAFVKRWYIRDSSEGFVCVVAFPARCANTNRIATVVHELQQSRARAGERHRHHHH